MLGRNSGFALLLKANTPHIALMHCLLHRHSLAIKTLPLKLAKELKIVVECVNYVPNSVMKRRIFKEQCNEMGFEFEVLLYYFNFRWLARGKMLIRVFVLRVELAVLLRDHQHRHADCFEISEFILILG